MRVLVVEDEVALAEGIARGLGSEGFDVTVVHDGREGYEQALEGHYDLMVLDIMLPSMNGYKVCRSLREAEVWTPILMLTAKDGEYDEAEALDTGADDFLSKPFSFVVLVARLKALARRRTDHNLQPLELGDLTLDIISRSCRRGDVDIPLSPREFALLEALLRHAGMTLTRDQLLDHAWPFSVAVTPNAVDAYVHYLRTKLGDAGSQVETVRGVGYRLADG